jgi:hypothetical protein
LGGIKVKTILLLLFFLIVLSSSTIYNLAVREDFSGSTFPPTGWTKIAKIVGGGIPSGGWSLQDGYAHGYVYSYTNTSYGILLTLPFHASVGDCVIIIFNGKPSGPSGLYPFIEIEHDGSFTWTASIVGSGTQWINYQYTTPAITVESSNYRIGWEVDDYLPSPGATTLDIDNIKVAVASPGTSDNTITQVEASSLGRIKSVYR